MVGGWVNGLVVDYFVALFICFDDLLSLLVSFCFLVVSCLVSCRCGSRSVQRQLPCHHSSCGGKKGYSV